jgi:hypothetical protein
MSRRRARRRRRLALLLFRHVERGCRFDRASDGPGYDSVLPTKAPIVGVGRLEIAELVGTALEARLDVVPADPVGLVKNDMEALSAVHEAVLSLAD